MKQIFVVSFFALFQLSVVAQFSEKDFAKLTKLEGNWLIQKNNSAILESWTKVSATEYTGKNFVIRNGDSTLNENLTVTFDGNSIKYIVMLMGQNNGKTVTFTLTKIENETYYFENPEHDFPKRIVYAFVGDKKIDAFIDDGKPNTTKKMYFNYVKQ